MSTAVQEVNSTTKCSSKSKTSRSNSSRTNNSSCDTSKIGVRNKELGKKGEETAAKYLEERGYQILERNWKCYAGEADIIAKDCGALVFVEVKTRRNTERGFPEESVTKAKRARYEKIALCYMSKVDAFNISVRFDVVAIVAGTKHKAMIRHHINAFSVVEK